MMFYPSPIDALCKCTIASTDSTIDNLQNFSRGQQRFPKVPSFMHHASQTACYKLLRSLLGYRQKSLMLYRMCFTSQNQIYYSIGLSLYSWPAIQLTSENAMWLAIVFCSSEGKIISLLSTGECDTAYTDLPFFTTNSRLSLSSKNVAVSLLYTCSTFYRWADNNSLLVQQLALYYYMTNSFHETPNHLDLDASLLLMKWAFLTRGHNERISI